MIEYTVQVFEDRTEWYLNSKYHREDGPAIEWANDNKAWYLNGQLHRVDGPAIETVDGNNHWFLYGQLHREDGPAFELSDGTKRWFLNGVQLTEEEFNDRTKAKELTVNQIEKLLGYKIKVIGR